MCHGRVGRGDLSGYIMWKARLRRGLMVKVLACLVEGPGLESHHGKSFS